MPKRLDEDVILTKLNTLSGHEEKTRTSIIDMMLKSSDQWSLKELSRREWILNCDNQLVSPSKAILPTKEIKNLLGKSHPLYLRTNINDFDVIMLERAKEIGILSDWQDKITLLRGLMVPDAMLSYPSYSP